MYLSLSLCLSHFLFLFVERIGQLYSTAAKHYIFYELIPILINLHVFKLYLQLDFVSHGNFNPELLTIAESPSITRFNFHQLENLEGLKTLDIHGNGLTELDGDIFDMVRICIYLAYA